MTDAIELVLTIGTPFAIAILLALAVWSVLLVSIRSAVGVVILFGVVYVLENATLGRPGINLGLWVYPDDFFSLIAGLALAYRVVVLKRGRTIPAAWWAFGAIQLAVCLWGIPQFGTLAAVEFRPTFYLWVGSALLATFGYESVSGPRYAALLSLLAVGLCGIAAYRWSLLAIDPRYEAELLESVANTGIVYRVITSGCALVVALAMLVSVNYATRGRNVARHFVLALAFGMVVVALQHRSVWLASVAGGAALLYANLRKRDSGGARIAALLMAVVTVAAVGASSAGSLSESVQLQAERAVNLSEGTAGDRVEGWTILLQEWATSGSPVTYAAGRPDGSGYTRYEGQFGEKKIEYMPHNYYVILLLRGGLVGLAVFAWFLASARAALSRRLSRGDDDFAPALFGIFVALLVYWLTYSHETPHFLVIGPLLAAICQERSRRLESSNEAPLPASPDSLVGQTI